MDNNNVSMSEMIQIMRFGGDAASMLFKAGKGTAKGTSKLGKGIYDATRIITMKVKVSLYYSKAANDLNYEKKMLNFKTLNKKTGGKIRYISVPTEDKNTLSEFCNLLKRCKIDASILPDLVPGDGQTQFAISEEHLANLDFALKNFDFSTGEITKKATSENQCKFISFSDYANNGNKEEVDKLTNDAVSELEKEQVKQKDKGNEQKVFPQRRAEQTKENIRTAVENDKFIMRKNSGKYYDIPFNDSMLVAETKEGYLIRLPRENQNSAEKPLYAHVKKTDVYKTADSQGKIWQVRKDANTKVSTMIKNNNQTIPIDSKNLDNKFLFERYTNAHNANFKPAGLQQKNKNIPKKK